MTLRPVTSSLIVSFDTSVTPQVVLPPASTSYDVTGPETSDARWTDNATATAHLMGAWPATGGAIAGTIPPMVRRPYENDETTTERATAPATPILVVRTTG